MVFITFFIYAVRYSSRRILAKANGVFKTNCAGEYEKNRKDMYEILHQYMEYAIGNAKRLNASNEGKLPSKAAPGTKVYELIEILKPYLAEE